MSDIETLIPWLVMGPLYAGFAYIIWRAIVEDRKFEEEIKDIAKRHSEIRSEIKAAYDLRMRNKGDK